MGFLFCRNCCHCSLLRYPPLKLIVPISPLSSKVVTTIVALSSPLHSPIHRVNVCIVWLLTNRLPNAVAASILTSGVALSWQPTLGFAYRSTGISNVDVMVVKVASISVSSTLILLSPSHLYHYTIIPDLHASTRPIEVLNDVNQPGPQFISGPWVRNRWIPSSRLFAFIGTTSTSSSLTRAKWFLIWIVIAIIQLSLTCVITRLIRPRVAMLATL